MANKYYYLVATLPQLDFGKPAIITKEGFLEEARKWLSPSDINILEQVDINDFKRSIADLAPLKEWKKFNFNLCSQLKIARITRKHPLDEKPSQEAARIMAEATPLLSEKALEKKRFYFLEEIEVDYYFDLNFLVVYFIKLQIIERLMSFDTKRAHTVFENCSEVNYV